MSKLRDNVNLILYELQRGDTSKQQVLFDYTYNYLKIIALKYAYDKNDYEDILIEAYVKVFRYIKTVDINMDGYNWLCKIVQNVAYDYNKKYVSTVPFSDLSNEPILGELEDNILNKDAFLKEVYKLSVSDQRLIYLKFYRDLPYSEIAKIVNSKKSTVHKRVSIIIDKIRENLNTYKGEKYE